MRIARLLAFTAIVTPALAQATWSQLYPAVSPPPRQFASMACFEPTGEVVLLFGITQQLATQGWSLQGNTWSAFPMPPQTGHARGLVYDSVRQRLVVFGGDSPLNNDTWLWDGVQWTNPAAAVRPPARSQFAMVFDRARGVAVVYGGIAAGGSYLDDLWEWDGTNWTQRAATTPLGPRAYSLMAFDPVQQDVIVYGGLTPAFGGSMVWNDTWGWDGTTWTHHTPTTPPPYDTFGAMVTDLHRQRVVMYGGSSGDGLTREWNGSEWNALPPPSPGPRMGHAMAYDASLRRTVVFGGTSGGSYVQDTWIYRTPLPAEVAAFGAGCAGTAGTPLLANAPYTLPWLGDTMRNVVQTIPAGEPGAVFVSSFGSGLPFPLDAIGMPGCELLVALDVIEFRTAIGGTAEWALSIPNTPSLAAASFRQQAFVFDLAANALGLVASNGVTVTLGIR